RPPRSVGLLGTSLLPLNGMIGAGIFALPAVLFAAVGPFAPWMMVLGGILFLPLIIVFAALARQFDHSGGPALYGDAAFGPFFGFQAGWTRFASSVTTIAANSHVVVSYAATLSPALGHPVAHAVAVIAFQIFFMAVNLIGMNRAVGTLGIVTLIKLAPLAALIVAGFAQGSAGLGLVLPQFTDTEAVVLLTFYAFMGFENVTMPAGELKRPRRDIPLAMIGMLALVTLIYVLIIWAYIAIVPNPGEGGDMALSLAADEAFGRVGAVAIVIAAAFSVGGNTLNDLVNTPRMTYGMAELRMLPRWFQHVSPRFLTPDFSILFVGTASILFSLTGGFVLLATAGTLSRLVTYLICSAAVPVLRFRGADIGWFEVAMAALAFIASIWIATHADARAWITLAGILLVGGVLYFIARRAPQPVDA
ncbi:MAG TPA: APC family permease, partial [Croceibacterium sp.]|nr:APC family permease [Croceibacterium sp.]